MNAKCSVAIVANLVLLLSLTKAEYDQKPIYHITPDDGTWMNDPNGPMFIDGYYHLFYQCNPYGTNWGNMSWAHVVSRDMVTWERLPIAMYNDMPYDIGGVFSGSASLRDDSPTLFYTCVDEAGVELQCAAVPASSGDSTFPTWTKLSSNPLISDGPPGWDGFSFRDPTVWELKDSTAWTLAAASTDNGVGVVAQYNTLASSYPTGWAYKGPMWRSDNENAGFHTWMVECPDFYPTDPTAAFERDTSQQYVLKYSIMETTQEFYEIGAYQSEWAGSNASMFVRDTSYAYPFYAGGAAGIGAYPGLLLDYGPGGSFYASKTFLDTALTTAPRRVLWRWSREADNNAPGRDWQGAQSLPRQVTLDPTRKLLRTVPIPEVDKLRDQLLYAFAANASNGAPPNEKLGAVNTLPVMGLAVDIEAEFRCTGDCRLDALSGWEFGFQARISTDGTRYTTYGYSVGPTSAGQTVLSLLLDSSRSGGSTPAQVVRNPLPHQADSMAIFTMRLLLDHSMTEVYVQDGVAAATLRIYPDEADQGLGWFVTAPEGGAGNTVVTLAAVKVYSMRSLWSA